MATDSEPDATTTTEPLPATSRGAGWVVARTALIVFLVLTGLALAGFAALLGAGYYLSHSAS
jgi:hypothetical protein